MSTKQAILFDTKKGWTERLSHEWLKEHRLIPIKPVHKTANYLRYRLQEPDEKHYRYRIINFGHGVHAVIGFRKD